MRLWVPVGRSSRVCPGPSPSLLAWRFGVYLQQPVTYEAVRHATPRSQIGAFKNEEHPIQPETQTVEVKPPQWTPSCDVNDAGSGPLEKDEPLALSWRGNEAMEREGSQNNCSMGLICLIYNVADRQALFC